MEISFTTVTASQTVSRSFSTSGLEGRGENVLLPGISFLTWPGTSCREWDISGEAIREQYFLCPYRDNNKIARSNVIVSSFPITAALPGHTRLNFCLKLIRYTKKKPGYRYDPDPHTLFSDCPGCAFGYDISLF